MKNKLKEALQKLNNIFFFGKYKKTYSYINQKPDIKEYILKFIVIFVLLNIALSIIFPNIFNTIILSFIITIFFINEIILNSKKLNCENYILSQLTIYISQMAMLINYNNIYFSIKEATKFLYDPIKSDLEKVIKNIDSGKPILESFNEFN
jgi:hypothetical protein